ncbi:MAG: ELM1/GtrOC1 family putative glycosyltransferase [Bacilli bacterium]
MKKVVILSDGRPGHFNQTLGIAEQLEEVEIDIINVRYKMSILDFLVRLFGLLYRFLSFSKPVIKFIFKIALKEKCYRECISTNPDLILSAGSSVATINAMLSKLKKAKSIVCMTPSFIGTDPFDLAVIPEHDMPPNKENIIKTIGAPNRINKGFMEKEIRNWNNRLELDLFSLKRPLISILLGGSDSYFTMDTAVVCRLIKEVEDYVETYNGQFLMTTSLRTPKKIETNLKNKLPNDKCPLLIIADEWEDNPVPMMVGISDIIIVTEDSVSMISESISGNNKVVLIGLEKNANKKRPSYLRVCKLLKERGYISFLEQNQLRTGELKRLMIELFSAGSKKHLLDDTARVAREIQERFL